MTSDDPLNHVFLKPGEMVVSDGSDPSIVTTLLGSCVAVTMFSARHRIGAICHALLPVCRHEGGCTPGHVEAGKYVECAVKLMLEKLASRGVGKLELETKLFGGSDMFESGSDGCRSQSVGRQNIEMALKLLERESLRPVTQDLGGTRGRKIIFHTHTGEVFLKRLRKSEL
jgi:chemotaxis protein CheD